MHTSGSIKTPTWNEATSAHMLKPHFSSNSVEGPALFQGFGETQCYNAAQPTPAAGWLLCCLLPFACKESSLHVDHLPLICPLLSEPFHPRWHSLKLLTCSTVELGNLVTPAFCNVSWRQPGSAVDLRGSPRLPSTSGNIFITRSCKVLSSQALIYFPFLEPRE